MADEMLKNAQPQELESQIGEEDGLKEQLLRMCRQNKLAAFSAVLILVVILIAIFAPVLAPYGEAEQDLISRLQGPSAAHWFGTDELGRDVFSRILYGSRLSLTIGILPSIISLVVGIFFGLLAGYFGGWVDNLIMRLVDIQLCFPFTLLALFIAAVLGSSLGNVILIAGITSWVRYARLVRGEILGIKEMEYIEAIRAAGGTDARIIFKHILPNIISPVIVIATLEMAKIVLIEASLSFLGYGVPITIPTWGRMLSEARDNILTDPWQCIFPGLCITLTVLGVNLLGDWLRDYLDPKLDV